MGVLAATKQLYEWFSPSVCVCLSVGFSKVVATFNHITISLDLSFKILLVAFLIFFAITI